MNNSVKHRSSERGSAAIKFLIVFVLILLTANAGYNYVPVAYNAENLKGDMQAALLQGLALPGKVNPVDNVKIRIQKAIVQNDIPPDAIVEVKAAGNSMSAHVVYSTPVNLLPFGMYRYMYNFDQTVTPTGFLLKQNN